MNFNIRAVIESIDRNCKYFRPTLFYKILRPIRLLEIGKASSRKDVESLVFARLLAYYPQSSYLDFVAR